MDKQTKTIVGTLLLSAFLIFMMVLLPQSVGLSRGGFDNSEVLQQYYFYVTSGISFLIGILILFVVGLYLNKKSSSYGNESLLFSNQGDKPSIPFFSRFTIIQLIWLSVIVFSSLSLWLSLTQQQTFTGIRFLENQFTQTDSAIFSSGLIPAAENLGLAFVIAGFMFLIRWLARKYNITSENFIGFAYLVIFIGGGYGVINHILRYGGSDIKLVTVFIFWTTLTLITLLTGSFVPAWIYHMMNNLFFDFKRFYSSEEMIIYFGLAILIITILYFVIYRNRLFGSNRETV